MFKKQLEVFAIIMTMFSICAFSATQEDFGVLKGHKPQSIQQGGREEAVTTFDYLWYWPAEDGSFNADEWQFARQLQPGSDGNYTAHFRDVALGAAIRINCSGLVNGETWSATWTSPTGVVKGPTTLTYQNGCFYGGLWYTCECGWPPFITYSSFTFYTTIQCSDTGVWTVDLAHNGAIYATKQINILPQIDESRLDNLDQHNPDWAGDAYDSLCYTTINTDQKPSFTCPETIPQDQDHCTINKKGCTITAATMLLKYQGITKDPDGQDLTPATLNSWLTGHSGYSNGNLNWATLPLFATACGKILQSQAHMDTLWEEICTYGPQFIRVPSPTGAGYHWLLAYGQDKDKKGYLVRDPNHAPAAPYLYTGSFSRSSALTFSGREKLLTDTLNGLCINFYCPVELVITDPSGRRTGFDPTTNTEYNEDPNAGYDNAGTDTDEGPGPETTKKIQTSASIDGDYTLAVIGTGTGNYSADITAFFNYAGYSQATVATLKNIGISLGTIHTYTIHYENKAGVTAALSGGFDGGGQRPKDVNKFLSYANPSESHIILPSGVNTFPLIIYYGAAVLPASFQATLNGMNVAPLFCPVAGGHETVNLALMPGRNILAFSIDGNLERRIATDTDRLVFEVQ